MAKLAFRLGRDRRGTTSLEFVLVAPLLILFLIGIIETSLMLWTWQAIDAVAVDTARCVAIGSTTCASPQSYAVQRANTYGIGSMTSGEVTVVTNSTACSAPNGTTMVQVSVAMPFAALTTYLAPLFPSTLKANACYPSAA